MTIGSPGRTNHHAHSEAAEAVTIASATALSLGTPANVGDVSGWRWVAGTDLNKPNKATGYSAVQAFDLEIWCDATETLSAAQLYGYRLHPVTIADDDVDTVDNANNELDLTSHAYLSGDGPVQLTTSDTLPTGLSTGTNYFVHKVGSGTISLHTSRIDAITGSDAVTFSDTGTGTHTIVDVQNSTDPDDDTQRVHYHLYGDINGGADISLGAQEAYVERINHSPLTIAYEVDGTLTNSETVNVRAVPVQDVEW